MLGVARDADAKAIRDAFRTLALKFHPDRNKEPGAEARFKEIAEAYAVLSDPKKRADYDAGGFAGLSGMSSEDLFGGINFDDLLRGSGFDFGHFDFGGGGLFDGFFGRRRRGPAPGRDIELDLVVPLSRVISGGEETIDVPRPARCGACEGSGAKQGTQPRECATCKGSGSEVKQRSEGGVSIRHISTCAACAARGRIIDQPCPECTGSGSVQKQERLSVKVPIGVDDATVLRIPGHGMPSEAQGGPPGDLRVTVFSTPDPRFKRAGADLWRAEHISIPQAVLGAKREVPTLDGNAEVHIPAGSEPDSVLRLRGKGLPRFGGGGHGDLLVRLLLDMPGKLSVEERKLYQQLLALQAKLSSA